MHKKSPQKLLRFQVNVFGKGVGKVLCSGRRTWSWQPEWSCVRVQIGPWISRPVFMPKRRFWVRRPTYIKPKTIVILINNLSSKGHMHPSVLNPSLSFKNFLVPNFIRRTSREYFRRHAIRATLWIHLIIILLLEAKAHHLSCTVVLVRQFGNRLLPCRNNLHKSPIAITAVLSGSRPPSR